MMWSSYVRFLIFIFAIFSFNNTIGQVIKIGSDTATSNWWDPTPVSGIHSSYHARYVYYTHELTNAQYSDTVLNFSSEYQSSTYGAAINILGNPDIFPDNSGLTNTWAPSTQNASREYIEIGYSIPMAINTISIYETGNNGAIDTVYIKNPNTNQWEVVYQTTATPLGSEPRILNINFPLTNYSVSEIRIAVNAPAVSGFNEIDAVGISAVQPGIISKIGFFTFEAPQNPLSDFSIKMKETDDSDAYPYDYGPITTVYSNPSYTPPTGYFDTLVLTTPFIWDGFSSILVDVCHDTFPGLFDFSGRMRIISGSYKNQLYIDDAYINVCQDSTSNNYFMKPQVIFALNSGTFSNDIGVSNVLSPTSICSTNVTQPVTVSLFNAGSSNESNFNVSYSVNNNTPVTETFTNVLSAGSSSNFTFSSSFTPSGVGSYNIKAWTSLTADQNNINDTTYTTIQVDTSFTISASPDSTICNGESLYITAAGANTYQWSNGANTSYNYISPSTTATYTVVGYNTIGCSDTETVTINVLPSPPPPVISAIGNTSLCDGDSVLLISNTAQNIIWNTGRTNDSIYATETDFYYVELYDSVTGCTGVSNYIYIQIDPEPEIQVLNYVTAVCLGDSVEMFVSSGASYNWSTGDTTAFVTVHPQTDTIYYVTGQTYGGCTYADSISFNVVAPAPPSAPGNLAPVDGALNLSKPILFSWSPSSNASHYDLYIWPKGGTPTSYPQESNINGISESYNGSAVSYGQTYQWKVVAKNSCYESSSIIQEFSLRDLPDLVAENVNVPTSIFAGQKLPVTWTVKNDGLGTTGSEQWKEAVYLSFDTIRDTNDILIGKINNLSYLQAGQKYTRTEEFSIPITLLGDFHVFLEVDDEDNILESDEQNNFAMDTVQSLLSVTLPPLPDLEITSIGVPTSIFSGSNMQINYTFTNFGNASAQGNKYGKADIEPWQVCTTPGIGQQCTFMEHFWYDAIYLSPDSIFNADSAILLDQPRIALRNQEYSGNYCCFNISSWLNIPDYLEADSSYTMTVAYDIPWSISGTYYLHILSDKFNDVDELTNLNNLGRSGPVQVTLSPPPDLVINSVSGPATAIAGSSITIDWIGENMGAGPPPPSHSWYDKIYISTIDTFNIDSAIALSSKLQLPNNPLPTPFLPDSTYSSSRIVSIPKDLSGQYYIYVMADNVNMIFEHIWEDNNVTRLSNAITITPGPFPDLEVISFQLQDTIASNTFENINYTITNHGVNTALAEWYDAIYISPDSLWNPSTAVLIYQDTVESDLSGSDTLFVNEQMYIPPGHEGDKYIFIVTDRYNDVYEVNENNNLKGEHQINASGPIHILPNPNLSNLVVQSIIAPTNAMSSSEIQVEYDVVNIGNAPTLSNEWLDRIYFSSDTILDQGDYSVSYYHNKTLLDVNESYHIVKQITVPNGLSGTYYIIIYTDALHFVTNELTKQDNQDRKAVQITLTPPPDLVVDTVLVPSNIYSGQKLNISFPVKNNGIGTAKADWNERFFLSSTPGFSPGMVKLGYLKNTADLNPGNNYIASYEVTIPVNVSGNYYLLVYADGSDDVYEHQNEGNNIKAIPVLISPPLPSDLKVSGIVVPDSAYLGEKVNVEYKIKNIGINKSIGDLRDQLDLSLDQMKDTSDFVWYHFQRYIEIDPGDSISEIVQKRLSGVTEGNYYNIISTNTSGVILESDLSNNTTPSLQPVKINIEKLPLNIHDTTDLNYQDLVYYRIDVGANLDLLITITSNKQFGSNEAYIAYNRIPTPADYDNKYIYPNSTDQKILVPATQAGAYYLFMRTTTSVFTDQEVDVLAKTLPFSIIDIEPDTVGQGIVNTWLNGAGFRDSTIFEIINTSGTAVAQADIAIYNNSMNLNLQWDFTNVPLGTYDVRAINPSDTFTLSQGITIEPSSGFLIDIRPITSNVVRFGSTGYFVFEVRNTGNVNIPYLKGEVLGPSYTSLLDMKVTGKTRKRSDYFTQNSLLDIKNDFDIQEYKVIPFFSQELYPGEMAGINLVFAGFHDVVFPLQVRAIPYAKDEYIQEQYRLAEMFRLMILNGSNIKVSTDIIQLAADSTAFIDSIMSFYYNEGYFTQQDVANTSLSCPQCDTLSIELTSNNNFSPGASPGTEQFNQIEFRPGYGYLWEINDYYGSAGDSIGWDLLTTSGELIISSTSSNPFTIYLASLDHNNYPGYLAGWYPAVDRCWPIAIADGGITGFNPAKFVINTNNFTKYNLVHGGNFSLATSGDTLLLCFTAYKPGPGEAGVPGAPGGNGQPGSPGGKGGDGAPGGPGGSGGPNGPGGPGGPGGDPTPQNANPPDGPNGDPGPTNVPPPPYPQPPQPPNTPPNTPWPTPPNYPPGPGTPLPFYPPSPGIPPGPGPTPPSTPPTGPPTGLPCAGASSSNLQPISCEQFFKATGCIISAAGCTGLIISQGTAVGLVGGVVGAAFGAGAGVFVAGVLCLGGLYTCWEGKATIPAKLAIRTICSPVVKSCDPNDIIGPDGYGPSNFVARKDILPYTIRYENDSTFASTAAQRVEIRQELDDHLHPLSFRVGDFGFGDTVIQVPSNSASYFNTIEMPDSLGYDVQVTAGLDILTNEIFWVFQTVDPGTGLAPKDPFKGYLAVNDKFGAGQGFVNYIIKPDPTSQTGDTIFAEADIVFDINPPILTPKIFNVIDAYPPVSKVDSLPATTPDTSITVKWSGSDDAGGSGLATFDIYVSENNDPYNLWLNDIKDSTAEYTGSIGNYYHFYSRSVDNVGNEEEDKIQPDASVFIGEPGFLLQPVLGKEYCMGDTITIVWDTSSYSLIDLEYAEVGSMNFISFATGINASLLSYNWIIPAGIIPDKSYVIRAVKSSTAEPIDTSYSFMIYSVPSVNAGNDKDFCSGDTIIIGGTPTASGNHVPFQYTWTPQSGLINDTIANPIVFTGDIYTVSVVNSKGCINSDNITVTEKPTPSTPIISQINNTTLSSSTNTGNQWFLNGNIVSGATGQTYDPTQSGFYSVVVTINGCSSDTSNIIEFIKVGIDDVDNAIDLWLYPNPNSGNFIVSFSLQESKNVELSILDIQGQLIFLDEEKNITGDYVSSISLKNIASGSYLLKLKIGEEIIYRGIIIE